MQRTIRSANHIYSSKYRVSFTSSNKSTFIQSQQLGALYYITKTNFNIKHNVHCFPFTKCFLESRNLELYSRTLLCKLPSNNFVHILCDKSSLMKSLSRNKLQHIFLSILEKATKHVITHPSRHVTTAHTKGCSQSYKHTSSA